MRRHHSIPSAFYMIPSRHLIDAHICRSLPRTCHWLSVGKRDKSINTAFRELYYIWIFGLCTSLFMHTIVVDDQQIVFHELTVIHFWIFNARKILHLIEVLIVLIYFWGGSIALIQNKFEQADILTPRILYFGIRICRFYLGIQIFN